MKLDTRQTKIIGLAAVFIFIFVLITLLVDVFIKSDSQKIGFQRNTSDTEQKVETVTTEAPIPAENSSDSIEIFPDYKDLEIDASLMKDPTALMLAIDGDGSDTYDNGLITKWMNAGTVPLGEKRPAGETVAHRLEEAAKFDDIYIKALMVDGWESNPDLAAWVKVMIGIHENVVTFNFATSNGLPGDTIPYRRGVATKYIRLGETLSANSIKLSVTNIDYDTAKDNRVSTEFGGGVTGREYDHSITFVTQNGKVKISDHIVAK